jgi:16S rRNA (guanine966-N2)-methyltransferase
VRGVIFDMLDALGADYARVLDLYAAVSTIEANVARTGFASRATIHRMKAEHAVSRLRGPYTLVLLDPPYYDIDVFAVAAEIAGSALVDDRSVIVVEHRKNVEPRERLGALPLYRSRRHGDTVVSIYAQEEIA